MSKCHIVENLMPRLICNCEKYHFLCGLVPIFVYVLQDWVPVIARDIETQRSQKSHHPHSDAYLQGMPPKRRRVSTKSNLIVMH